MAVRSIRRNLGRSLLIALLIGLPVAVATFGDVLYRSIQSPATDAYRSLGNADAKLVVTPGKRLNGFQVRSESWHAYRYKLERDPDTVDVAGLLPPGTRMEESTIRPGPQLLLSNGQKYEGSSLQQRAMPSRFLPERLEAGRFPKAGEVALARRTADKLGVAPGDTVTDDLTGTRIRVSGIVRDEQCFRCGGVYSQPGQQIVPTPKSAIEHRWDVVQPTYLLDLPPGTDMNALAQRLAEQGVVLFPRDTYLHPDKYDPVGMSSPVTLYQVRAAALTTLIVGLGLLEVILLAGAAFAVGARKQVREMGLISAEGGSPRQLRTVLLVQGGTLGVIGTVAGVVVGLAVARLGWPLWEQLNGAVIPVYRFGPEILIAVVVGVASGVLAAVVPAIGAARKAPLDALSARFRVSRERSRRTSMIGGFAVLAGVALGYVGSAQMASDFTEYAAVLATARQTGMSLSPPSPAIPIALVLTGAVLAIAGLVLVMPLLLGTLSRLGARLPLAGRLAVRDADRHRHRTGPATSAIMLAIAGSVVAAFAIAGTARAEEARWTPQLPPHTMQVVIGRADTGDGAVQDAVIEAAAQRAAAVLPGATVLAPTDLGYPTRKTHHEQGTQPVQPLWFNTHNDCNSEYVQSCAQSTSAAIADPALVRLVLGRDLTDAESAALDRGEVLALSPGLIGNDGKVTASLEAQAEVQPDGSWADDQLETRVDDYGRMVPTLSLPARAVDTKVTYRSMPGLLMSEATATQHGLTVLTGVAYMGNRLISYPADATPSQVRAALRVARAGLRAYADVQRPYQAPDRLPLLIIGLLAGLITLIGVGIAIALSAAESRRELATLAAVGAPPRLRRQLAGAQAMVISGVGALVGIALGCFVSYALRATFGAPSFTVPWANLLAVGLGIPVLAALIAALFTRARPPMLERRC